MCAYLVGPAVGAGGRNALAWSTCVALADVLLLAARWRCTDRDGANTSSGNSSTSRLALEEGQHEPHGGLWEKSKGLGGDVLSSQRDWCVLSRSKVIPQNPFLWAAIMYP